MEQQLYRTAHPYGPDARVAGDVSRAHCGLASEASLGDRLRHWYVAVPNCAPMRVLAGDRHIRESTAFCAGATAPSGIAHAPSRPRMQGGALPRTKRTA